MLNGKCYRRSVRVCVIFFFSHRSVLVIAMLTLDLVEAIIFSVFCTVVTLYPALLFSPN